MFIEATASEIYQAEQNFRIVVLASGSGTLLQALIDADHEERLLGRIVAVGSDQPQALALSRAKEHQIPSFCLPYEKGSDREEWDAQLTNLVASHQPDLVVSAGFMRLFGKHFLAQFQGKIINSHPSLLPAFPGIHAPRDALAAGVKISGATVFLVDEGMDTGKILAQAAVEVSEFDTIEELHERIKVVERSILVETINKFIEQEVG